MLLVAVFWLVLLLLAAVFGLNSNQQHGFPPQTATKGEVPRNHKQRRVRPAADAAISIAPAQTASNGLALQSVRINPLISVVWIGYIALMAGCALGVFARRGAREEAAAHE